MWVQDVKMAGTTETVSMYAVTGGSDENKTFAKSTPCATFSISIDNPVAQGFLIKGNQYYIDITPAI